MFRPEPMNQINIFVEEADVLDLTLALGQMGVLHISPAEDSDGWETAMEHEWSDQADQYHELKNEISELMSELGIEPIEFPPVKEIKPGGEAKEIKTKIEDINKDLSSLSDKLSEKNVSIEEIQLLKHEAQAISPLEMPIENFRELDHIHLVVGSLPSENYQRLKMALFRIPFVIIPIAEHDDSILIVAASAQPDGAILDRALESALLERLELPEGVSGSPQDVLDSLENKLKAAKEEREKLTRKRNEWIEKHKKDLLEMWSQVNYNTKVMETISSFAIHDHTYLISGWAPENEINNIVNTVDEITEGEANVEVIETTSKQGEAPTHLQNPPLLKAFQNLLTIFGLPAYNQIDPTPFVAVTFLMMFGMMFGDVGHGGVLVLGGLSLLFFRKDRQKTSIAPVLIAAGIFSMAFGFLFGSFFGRENILPHLWTSPIENVMNILLVAVAGGVIVLNIGFLLNLTSAWRSSDWGELFFSHNGLAGIVLYWTILLGGVRLFQGANLPLTAWAIALLIPIAIILLKEPIEGLILGERPIIESSWTNYLISSFFELFESLLGFFTNTISFVRLGAFAVAHAALGQVIFIMSDLVSGVWRWLIIIIGTLIVIGFEGMVVGIQAIRLEYYEFFDKFYKGVGHPYQPFRLSTESKTNAALSQ